MRKFKQFFENEASGGIVLILCAALALIIANTPSLQSYYSSFLHFYIDFSIANFEIIHLSVEHFVNDALMAIFFIVVAIEIKHEMLHGHLSSFKQASFPFFGALGGIIFPIIFYFLFTFHDPNLIHGAAIPMATDIAFAIGVLSLLGKLVPPALKIFLLALAVIDDLGAIVVIAIFYTTDISFTHLGVGIALLGLMFLLNRMNVKAITPYLLIASVVWYCFLHSGIHATIAGVLTGFLLPNRDINGKNVSNEVANYFNPYVKWLIIPLFAFANSGVTLGDVSGVLAENSSLILGIFFGLLFGKPIGILIFTFVASKLKITAKPQSVTWDMIFFVGIICGIGFTMSIFIVNLSFPGISMEDRMHIDIARLSILGTSSIAAIIGLILTRLNLKHHEKKNALNKVKD
ncbi:Na+/H+ antiporter NhaA [Psittacicella hinzii]|uniref:Na(+)/H(+) antiporter NhaA n=1 Tax=Psittacicella hinzii TaxID=2028575 RepID=A0A3A1Y456_9GAMM|nr:Na+/H+ antiporter NhaA [Psittacicella hinzii]RIY33102.1 Na+/H+ antiporter NhaA [Psittacicella hinzii]